MCHPTSRSKVSTITPVALWKDESIVPVRGQIAWLIPRRDGIVVQSIGGGEMYGYNDANEAPDRAAAKAAVGVLAGRYGRICSERAYRV